MQLLIRHGIISFLVYFIFSIPFVYASELDSYFSKAQKGEISISELVDFIIAEVLESPGIGPEVARNKHLVTAFPEASAPILINKIQSLVAESKFEQAWAIKSLVDNIIPPAWPESRRINQIFEVVTKLEEIESKKDIRGLSLLKVENLSSEDAKIIEDSVKFIATNFLKQAGEKEDKFITIRDLADLSVSFSDLGLEVELKKALDSLSQQKDLSAEKWTFDNPTVQQFILENFQHNSKELYLLYKWRILKALEDVNQNRASIYYNLINSLLNDSQKEELKIAIMNQGLKTGLNPFVISRIDELRTARRLSALDKLQLILKGYFGWLPLLVPVAIFLLLLKIFKKKQKVEKKFIPTVADDEYTTLLKKLNLHEDASESEIKKAFRQLVKEHHPDAHGTSGVVLDADGKVDQKFEELRKTYDRILEIRKSWFGASR